MIAWVTAFVDVPRARLATATDFWSAVTGTLPAPVESPEAELTTCLPADGDPHLRLVATDDELPGVHVHLHSADPEALASTAEQAGGRVLVRGPGHVVLRSPGGFVVSCVGHDGEVVVPSPVAHERVDQVCIDVPRAAWDAELAWWAATTGWHVHQVSRREDLTLLRPPRPTSMQVLLQRLDAEEGPVVGHLDLAVGDSQERLEQATARHTSLGADFVAEHPWWHVMRAPDGSTYCLTRREPDA